MLQFSVPFPNHLMLKLFFFFLEQSTHHLWQNNGCLNKRFPIGGLRTTTLLTTQIHPLFKRRCRETAWIRVTSLVHLCQESSSYDNGSSPPFMFKVPLTARRVRRSSQAFFLFVCFSFLFFRDKIYNQESLKHLTTLQFYQFANRAALWWLIRLFEINCKNKSGYISLFSLSPSLSQDSEIPARTAARASALYT